MKLEFTNSINDLNDASIILSKINPVIKKKRFMSKLFYCISVIILYILLLIYYGSKVNLLKNGNFKIVIVLFIIMIASIPLCLYFCDTLLNIARKILTVIYVKKRTDLITPRTLILDNGTLTLKIIDEKFEYDIAKIEKVLEYKGKIYIFKNLSSIIAIIPVDIFKNNKDKEMFLNMLKTTS